MDTALCQIAIVLNSDFSKVAEIEETDEFLIGAIQIKNKAFIFGNSCSMHVYNIDRMQLIKTVKTKSKVYSFIFKEPNFLITVQKEGHVEIYDTNKLESVFYQKVFNIEVIN